MLMYSGYNVTLTTPTLFPRQMSDIVGFDLKPEPTTPLSKMIEYGLDKQLDKYMTISIATCTYIMCTWVYIH